MTAYTAAIELPAHYLRTGWQVLVARAPAGDIWATVIHADQCGAEEDCVAAEYAATTLHYGVREVLTARIPCQPDEVAAEPDPMPVFVLKGKDALAADTVDWYMALCQARGLFAQAAQVQLAREEILAWQDRHPGRVKFPDHEHVPAGGETG